MRLKNFILYAIALSVLWSPTQSFAEGIGATPPKDPLSVINTQEKNGEKVDAGGNTTYRTVDMAFIQRVYQRIENGKCPPEAAQSLTGALECLYEDTTLSTPNIDFWKTPNLGYLFEIIRNYPSFVGEFITKEEIEELKDPETGEITVRTTDMFVDNYLERTGQKTEKQREAEKKRKQDEEFRKNLAEQAPVEPDEDAGYIEENWYLFKKTAYGIYKAFAEIKHDVFD